MPLPEGWVLLLPSHLSLTPLSTDTVKPCSTADSAALLLRRVASSATVLVQASSLAVPSDSASSRAADFSASCVRTSPFIPCHTAAASPRRSFSFFSSLV